MGRKGNMIFYRGLRESKGVERENVALKKLPFFHPKYAMTHTNLEPPCLNSIFKERAVTLAIAFSCVDTGQVLVMSTFTLAPHLNSINMTSLFYQQ